MFVYFIMPIYIAYGYNLIHSSHFFPVKRSYTSYLCASASASVSTTVYKKDTEFLDNLKATTLTPSLGSSITIDARPNQDLRLFSKFNFNLPFATKAVSSATSLAATTAQEVAGVTKYNTFVQTDVETKISDWIQLKEMFTDFNAGDYTSFRFGRSFLSEDEICWIY